MSAGYSGTPLVKKLGLKPGQRILILNPPENYAATLGDLPDGLLQVETATPELDFIQWFTKDRAELEQQFPDLKAALAPDGMLWISWPKKASKVPTDLDENLIREIGLRNGLVDVKVAAVDATWSGLKFVYRLEDRPKIEL
ncbi:MAG: DUF3052 family protein [Anaerolineae bacterium]|nr:DUF3052 family protein [Anaerolineae bacterium]